MEVKVNDAQGRRRQAGSEGSVEETRDLTNRNRIGGSLGRTSGLMIAKSISRKTEGT
jgi:hypothetical protein